MGCHKNIYADNGGVIWKRDKNIFGEELIVFEKCAIITLGKI